jgi:hypothetical protein
MSHIANHRIYYLDSHNRVSGTHSNFTIKVEIPTTEQFDRVVVLSAVIPRSYYLVQSPYNTFTLRENSIDTTITIAEGNYSYSMFKTYLINLLNSSSSQSWTYNILTPTTTQPQTGKYTFSVTGNGLLQPTFIFPSTTKIFEQLGFDNDSTNTFIANTLTSTNVVRFLLEDTLYIHSNITSGLNDDILQEIFTSGTSDFSSIKFQNFSPIEYSKPMLPSKNNSYRFTLTDEDAREINLNGLNIVITLLVYKNEDYFGMQKDFIKYQLLQKNNYVQ